MTTSMPSSLVESSPKPSPLSGCIVTGLGVWFTILGTYRLIWAAILAFIFSSAGILSLFNASVVFMVICESFIYFVLAFRIKRQHWMLSLALVTLVWLILPIAVRSMNSISTATFQHNGHSTQMVVPDEAYYLVDKRAYLQKDPQRGDIIMFRFPLDPEQIQMKRVIGLPGETIKIQDGIVTVNGTTLEEPYVTKPAAYDGTWGVPDGQYFVLGDSRNISRDSHAWGFLPRENIIAKVVFIFLPLAHFGKIDDVDFPQPWAE